MAEKIKDAEDRMLESLFASESVADDGFSATIVKQINRKLWLRRLTLPIAALIGGLIAFKPLMGLITLLSGFVSATQVDLVGPIQAALPQTPLLAVGALLLAAGMIGTRIIED